MGPPDVSGPPGPAETPGALSAALLRQVLAGTPAGIGVLDADLRYVYVNQALARMNGRTPEEHLGRTVREVLPALDAREEILLKVLADGIPRESTTSGHTRAATGLEHRYWHAAYHRLEAGGRILGIVGVIVEVGSAQRQQHDLEQARERLALLDTAVTRIGTTLEVDTTCGELADFLVPVLADIAAVEVFPVDRVAAMPAPDGPLRLRRAALAALPELREAATAFGAPGEYLDFEAGSTIPRSMASGRAEVLNLSAGRGPLQRGLGVHSAVVIPLTARGTALGALTMARAGGSPAFTEEDVVAAQELAGRAAISLDNARRYTREHDIALELQKALLSEPSSPHPGIEVAARYLPAGHSALVGGDWYDSIRRPYGRTLLVMGDVMGHGVEAAVDMSTYRSMLRVIGGADLPPHRVLRQLDAMISGTPDSRPVTCLLALADPVHGKLSCARAGHLPPAILRAGGGTDLLRVPAGPPLGTGYGGYELVTVEWQPGDVLLMYTDGLVEHRREDIDASLDRLRALRLPVHRDLEFLVDRVLEQLVRTAAEDDVAVMAARFHSRPASRPSSPGTGLAPHAT